MSSSSSLDEESQVSKFICYPSLISSHTHKQAATTSEILVILSFIDKTR